uniref:Uncharacterized protein n=1 Tax=Siphoviridae sp. ctE6L85 TaxID=2826202 RepID=A0A8S5QQP2_9CAUD|nr:MAG TPA: hypothetical protein [Siphoviridae sp. ctE6L85]
MTMPAENCAFLMRRNQYDRVNRGYAFADV